MRDKGLQACLNQWNGVFGGGHFSDKPFQCASLSEILESETSEKYYLSPKACRGILRRAAKRGKELPPHLAAALKAVADSEPIAIAMED